jgi:hypothetical protein
MNRQIALAVGVALALLAAAVWASGGFVVTPRAMRVSARSPIPAAVLALGALVVWAVLARRAQAACADLTGADVWLRRHAQAFVVVIAGLAAAVSLNFQTFSAAGADASGYFSQAAMLADGRLTRDEPLASIATWSGGGATLVPLGWRAAADPTTQVPTYAIGLPLLMAPLHSLGGLLLASLIGPLSLALAIWAVARLAAVVSGPAAAILSAVWLATSPVSLISATQPMSDMPATAAWLFCLAIVVAITASEASPQTAEHVGRVWLRLASGSIGFAPLRGARVLKAVRKPDPSARILGLQDSGPVTVSWRAVTAGCVAAIAVLIRPNIAPVAAIPALMLLTTRGRTPAVLFAAPVAVAGALIAFVQWRWFGSPLRSGYGTADEIYALANVGANVRLYGEWLLDTHGPWLLAAPLAAVAVPSRALRWLLLFAAAVVAAYLVYAVFETWTYLRFVLPALAIAMVATSALVATLRDRLPAVLRAGVLLAIVIAIAALQLRSARSHDAFRTADRHARASLAGRYLAAAMPARSVIIAGEQSGALRYYTGHSILRWEVMTPDGLTAATTSLADAGYEVWIGLDEWEEDLVRQRFKGSDVAALDWPPLLEAGTLMRTRAWRLRDREPFLRSATSHTDLVK